MDKPTQPQVTAEVVSTVGPKKPYTAPQVVVHGTVAELTLKIGTNNDVDQGGSFNPQTN